MYIYIYMALPPAPGDTAVQTFLQGREDRGRAARAMVRVPPCLRSGAHPGAGKAKQGPAEHGRKSGIQRSGSSPDLTVLGA